MEDSSLVDVTLRIYRRLREAGHDNVGTVLQSYLYRTRGRPRVAASAAAEPADRQGRVQGAGVVAYPKKADVDAAYDAARRALRSTRAGSPRSPRTTRQRIEHALALGAGPDRMELQMLYGVRSQLQLDLVASGNASSVATPYGPDWFPYLMRRLAERPGEPPLLPEERPRG